MLGISHRAGGCALHAGSGWSWLSMMPVAAIRCPVKYYVTAQKRHGEGTSRAAMVVIKWYIWIWLNSSLYSWGSRKRSAQACTIVWKLRMKCGSLACLSNSPLKLISVNLCSLYFMPEITVYYYQIHIKHLKIGSKFRQQTQWHIKIILWHTMVIFLTVKEFTVKAVYTASICR